MVFQHRYRVIRCIKAGGMGAVYEVLDERTNSPRALKVMLPSVLVDQDMRQRFQREAIVTADIESEHIVEIFDIGTTEEGRPYVEMELLIGESLAQHGAAEEGLRLAFTIAWVSEGLSADERARIALVAKAAQVSDERFEAILRETEPKGESA